jgi:hypothetical protein
VTAALCPGCSGPTEMMTLHYGSGADHHTVDAPAWCWPCIHANVRRARAGGDCRCGQIAGEHVHHAAVAAPVSGWVARPLLPETGPGAAVHSNPTLCQTKVAPSLATQPPTRQPARPAAPPSPENETCPGVWTDVAGTGH